jgi:hypothetical protein
MNNFADAFQRVQNMLSTEEGQRQVRDMMSSLGVPAQVSAPAPLLPTTPVSAPMFEKLGGLLGGADSSDSGADKTQLLHALRPHLSTKRLGKFDTAVKLMQVSRFANVRNLNGISNILNILGG